MALPKARVDMKIDDTWVDVTCDVRATEKVVITRGRANEASRVDPSMCNVTLLDPTGKYSPDNPRSPYYGLIGRNTPLRAGVGTPPAGDGTGGQTGTSLVAPSVTAEASGWQVCAWLAAPAGNITAPGGFVASSEQDGALSTMRSADKVITAGATGTATATFSTAATSSAAVNVVVPGVTSSTWTVSHQTGGAGLAFAVAGNAGDHLLAFYGWSSDPGDRMPSVADAEGGCEWMLVADTGPSDGPRIKAYIRRLTVAGPLTVTFYGNAQGSVDVHGQVWTLGGATGYRPRFTGEIPAWSPKWDPTGRGLIVAVQASGILRRLGQGKAPLRSALQRQFSTTKGVVAYWALEDGPTSTSFASSIGGHPMGFIGTPALAADDGFACAASLPTFTAAGAVGTVPAYPTTNQFTVGALIHIPPTGMLDESTLLSFQATGSVRAWRIKYDADSVGFRVEASDALGASVLNQAAGPWNPSLLDARFFLYLTAAQSGADIAWVLRFVPIVAGSDFPTSSTVGASILGQTVGAVQTVGVGWALDLAGEPSIGHVVVASTTAALFLGNVWQALVAWNGERAGDRVLRICGEEGIPCYLQGPALSETMGPQRPGALLDLLGECEAADAGVLFEPKGFLGLAFRTRTSKYNQTAGLTLSYSAKQISAPFEPVPGDQGLTNDVTVTRRTGSSARAVLETGPLSVQEPPDGVGLYDTSVELNLHTDSQLPDQASWRRHVGTNPDARYPSATVNLGGNPGLVEAVTALDIGDLLSVTDLPTFLAPGAADLIVEGHTETIGNPNDWVLTANCSPAGPYRVGVYDATATRYSSDGSSLAAGATSTAGTLSVATPAGPLWITTASHPAQFPFTITVAGEDITATGITGTSSPQTFAVTRSANGIVKAQIADAAVELAVPAVYAL